MRTTGTDWLMARMVPFRFEILPSWLRYWIDGIAYRVLNGHPEIETLRRPAPDENGVERWRPLGIHDQFRFRVKPGVKEVRFGDPGWRLGYTKDAVNSYFVFRQLKKEGVLPAALRFQVSLPLTYSAVTLFFVDPEDHPRIVPGFTAALRAEVAKMIELIPPEDLAIQWDLAVENRYIEGTLAREGAGAARGRAPDGAGAGDLALHSGAVGARRSFLFRHARRLAFAPAARPHGFGHSTQCRGCRLRPMRRFPSSADTRLRRGRVFRTAAGSQGGRRQGLSWGDPPHARRRRRPKPPIASRTQISAQFGIAAPCGCGRVPERPGRFLTERGSGVPTDYLEIIRRDHLNAVGLLREIMKD